MNSLYIGPSEKILVLAPHPDDESIGCGGLLLAYPDQCDVVVLTDGRHGGHLGETCDSVISKRQAELNAAMSYCGVKTCKTLGIEDGTLREHWSIVQNLSIGDYDLIFVPAPEDDHVDHACVYDFLSRMNHNAKVFGYEVRSTLSKPSHYIDISAIAGKKRHLIGLYYSQISQVDYVSKILGLNCYRGMLVYPAISYAEAYMHLS